MQSTQGSLLRSVPAKVSNKSCNAAIHQHDQSIHQKRSRIVLRCLGTSGFPIRATSFINHFILLVSSSLALTQNCQPVVYSYEN